MARTLVVFDVDSTLLSVESLDFAVERALRSAPDGAERTRALTALTDQGMAGEIDFRTSLERRIAIAGLTRDSVAEARDALRNHLTPGMAQLIVKLREQGQHPVAVSGGFGDLIGAALEDLGLSDQDVWANRFEYDAAGIVTGFDGANPLSRSGGKSNIVRQIRHQTATDSVVMIGDGMTDFEVYASGAAERFYGFGGVVTRDAVKAKAPVWANDVAMLDALLID